MFIDDASDALLFTTADESPSTRSAIDDELVEIVEFALVIEDTNDDEAV